MQDEKKTKAQLIAELNALRARTAELNALESQRLDTAEALRQGEEHSIRQYRSLVENLEHMTFVVTLDGHFTFASPQAKTITGYDADDLLLKTYKDLIAPADIEAFQRRLAYAAGGRKVPPFEVALRHAAGHEVEVELFLAELWEESGQTSVLGAAKDITERKRAEEKLRI